MASIKDLKGLIDKVGTAQVAAWLGYRDSRTIRQWVARGQIPLYRRGNVSTVILMYEKGEL